MTTLAALWAQATTLAKEYGLDYSQVDLGTMMTTLFYGSGNAEDEDDDEGEKRTTQQDREEHDDSKNTADACAHSERSRNETRDGHEDPNNQNPGGKGKKNEAAKLERTMSQARRKFGMTTGKGKHRRWKSHNPFTNEEDTEDDSNEEDEDYYYNGRDAEFQGLLTTQSSSADLHASGDEDSADRTVQQSSSHKRRSLMKKFMRRRITLRLSRRASRHGAEEQPFFRRLSRRQSHGHEVHETMSDADKAYLADNTPSLSSKQVIALAFMRETFAHKSCREINQNLGTFRLNDATYLKFLKSKDFVVKRAVDMLDSHLEWRDDYMPANLRSHDVKEALATGLVRRAYHAKDGCPVLYVDLGMLVPRMFAGEDIRLFVKLCAYVFERSIRDMPPGIYENIMIVDAGRFSYQNQACRAAMDVLKMLVQILQASYPGLLRNIYLLNPPSITTIAWNAIRFIISRDLKNRIVFVRKNEQMRDLIDPSMLMAEHGGDRVEPFPIHGVDLPFPGDEEDFPNNHDVSQRALSKKVATSSNRGNREKSNNKNHK